MIQKAKKIIFFGFFLTPIILNPWSFSNPFELTKQSFLFLLMAFFLALVLFNFIDKKKVIVGINRTVFLLIFLWFASFIVSTLFSMSPVESFWGSYERMQGSLTNIVYLIFFLIALQTFKSPAKQNVFFGITAALGFFISLYAIYQNLTFNPQVFSPDNIAGGRSYSTLGNPTALGQFLIFPFFIIVFLLIENFKRASGKINLKSIFLVLTFLLTIAALFLTNNRASMLGIGLSIIFFIIYLLKNRKAYAVLILTAAVIALSLTSGKIDLRSMGSRIVLWKSSIPLISQNPIFGNGPETYYQTIQTTLKPDLYLYERLTDIPDRSHNEILDAILTRGAFGFTLYSINLFFLAYVYFKRKLKTPAAKMAFFGILAYTISVQFGFSQSSHFIYLATLWAILLRETVIFKNKELLLSKFIEITGGIAILLISAFLISTSYKLIKTDYLFDKAISSYLISPQASFDYFKKTFDNTPQYSYLYQSLFIFFANEYTDLNLYPELNIFAENFGKLTRNSFQYELAKANLSSYQGNWEQAYAHFTAAQKKAPAWPILFMDWGQAAFSASQFEQAKNAFEKLLEIAPPYWRFKTSKDLTEKQAEQYRIFSISNTAFYEALNKLIEVYKKLGQKDKAAALEQYI